MLAAPGLIVLSEPSNYWEVLKSLLTASQVNGPRVHDARVAALCLAHGVSELWSADRDFSRFPDLVVRNPLIA
jgi:predicted nucleic acid-binding protein